MIILIGDLPGEKESQEFCFNVCIIDPSLKNFIKKKDKYNAEVNYMTEVNNNVRTKCLLLKRRARCPKIFTTYIFLLPFSETYLSNTLSKDKAIIAKG